MSSPNSFEMPVSTAPSTETTPGTTPTLMALPVSTGIPFPMSVIMSTGAASSLDSSSTPAMSSSILNQFKETEKAGLEQHKVIEDLEKEVGELTSKKENLMNKIDENRAKISKTQKDHVEMKGKLDSIKTSLKATRKMLSDSKEEMAGSNQRINLLREMTRIVDEQAVMTEKVVFEFGPYASKQATEKRFQENKDECRQKLKTAFQLLQEKQQYDKMIEENNVLTSELDLMKLDLQETEETVDQLKEESDEVLRRMTDMMARKETDNRIPDLKQEVRELQVKLSNMFQAGKRPTASLDILEDKRPQGRYGMSGRIPEKEDKEGTGTPQIRPKRKFVFKRR